MAESLTPGPAPRQAGSATPCEDLLAELAGNRWSILVQLKLPRAAWAGYARESNHLRVYGNQLRRTLEADPWRPRLILTGPRRGYRRVWSERQRGWSIHGMRGGGRGLGGRNISGSLA